MKGNAQENITEMVISMEVHGSRFTLTLPRLLVRMLGGEMAPLNRHTRRKGIR